MNVSEVSPSSSPTVNRVWVAVQVGIWSCLTLLTVTGNVVVLMCMALGAKRLRSTVYLFYASLATSDCLVGMFCTPLLMVSTMYQDWILGDGLCQAYAAILSTSLNASIATLCLISMDRLNAVKHPFDYRSHDTFTQRWSKPMTVIVWVHSAFWGVAPVLGWGEIVRDSATYSCKPNWSADGIYNRSYSLFLALFAFGIPVGTLVVVYCLIYYYSRKCSQWMKDHEGQKDKARESIRLLRERAVFKTVLIILGAFTICWAVYTLTTLSKLFIRRTPPNWFIQLGLLLALAGSCVNPVIYAIRDKRLSREFFNLPYIRKCLCMHEAITFESRDTLAQSESKLRKLSVVNGNCINKSPGGSREMLYKLPDKIIPLIIDRKHFDNIVQDSMPMRIREDLTTDMVERMQETHL